VAFVELTDDAKRMLLEADERWMADHGFLEPNPLVEEVEHVATQLLARDPLLGKRYRRARGRQPEIRRVLLRTGWHLYYSVDASLSRVQILAVWFASRGGDPPL
jgi:hypothetical protein